MAIVRPKPKTFPLWFQNENINANYLDEYIRCLENLPVGTQTTDVSYIPVTAGSEKWIGGAMNADGVIYCAPHSSTTILKIDTNTDTVSEIGSFVGSEKYGGGVLANNGKIYFIPKSAAEVLVIDPSDDSTYTFGNGDFTAGSNFFIGGCLDKTGTVIYCAPFNGSAFLKIDTKTDTVTTFAFTGHFGNGSLAPNGDLYFPPATATRAVKVDTSTDTATLIGSTYVGSHKWYSSVVSKEGNVYGSATSQATMIKIDTTDDTTSTIVSNNVRWGGCMGMDGKLYWSPGTTNVTALDTTDDSVVEITVNTGGSNAGILLAPNGKLYTIPRSAPNVAVIGTEIPTDKNLSVSRFNNKL